MTVSSTETAAAPAEVTSDAGAGSSPVEVSNDATAGSSPAPEGVEKTLFGAVSDALKEAAGSPSATGGEGKTSPPETTTSEAAPAENDQKNPDGTPKYPKNLEGRVRQLNDRAKELQIQLATATPKAETLDRITSYMQTHGIQPRELDNLLHITGLIKGGRFDDARKALEPIWKQLDARTGNILPDALQQRVRRGELTDKDARTLHRSQVEAQNATAREQQVVQRTETERQQRAFETLKGRMAEAVTEWDQRQAQSDPDWHLKQEDVAEQLELEIHRGGYPRNQQEAVAIAERAQKAVNARFKKFAPRPTERKPVIGDSASPRATARPKTLLEAVERGLAAAHG